MIITSFLAICLALSSIGTLVYMFICRDGSSRYVSVRRIGIIERDLEKLIRVVVVANRVDKPINTLQDAVEDNFRERVQYLFLVSKSNSREAKMGYYQIFEHLARMVANNYHISLDLAELVQIKSLSYEWPYPPHIFYQYTKKGSEKLFTICFKGNQRGEGIASFYEIISGSQAEALIHSLLSDAPSDIEVVSNISDISLKETKSKLESTFSQS